MNTLRYNAPGIGGPADSDETLRDLVIEYMDDGMSQSDAEIAAACKLDELREMALMDAGEDAYEALQEGEWDYD